MKKWITIILMAASLLPLTAAGRKHKPQQLTAEEQQQFLYYFYEAQRLLEAEDYDRAFELVWFCYGLNPDDAIVNQNIGDYYAGYRQPQKAAEHYERSRASDPLNTPIYYRLEGLYADLGEYKKALKARDMIDRQEGYSIYSAMSRYRLHAMAGETKKAIRAVNDYLRHDPDNLQFLVFRMQLYEAVQARTKDMVQAYESILAIEPFQPTVLNNYAYLLATRKGDLKKAEEMSRHSLQAEPHNPTFLDTYAWIMYLQGEKQLAKMYIQSAVRQMGDAEWPAEIAEHYRKIMQDRK